MDEQQAEELINKYSKGLCTSEEKAFVEAWFTAELNKRNAKQEESDYEIKEKELWNQISEKTIQKPAKNKIWLLMASAAAVLLVVSAAIFLYTYRANNQSDQVNQLVNDIAPGGNKAFLTLGDGKRIALTDIKNGEIAQQSGVKITKAADGQLIYTVSNLSNGNNKKAYNTIETPRGGTYRVRLPDGTKVWLNAASTIKYPVSFSSQKERRVTLLSGEAYFEVFKNKQHPFIVQTDKQEVKVLGTHFNINSYLEEKSVKTTLIEGMVQISNANFSEVLKPGEQSINDGGEIEVTKIDTESVIAWRQGNITFENQELITTMRQISRWYDVDVTFETGAPIHLKLGGLVPRSNPISVTLKAMEATGKVKFKIEGRRIFVLKE